MNDHIISHFSFRSLTSSVTLPVHEPISFGFEDMVKAKAEADAAVSEEIERQLIEKAIGNGNEYRYVSYSDRDCSSSSGHFGYIYDYNTVAELSAIKKRKKRR